MIKTFTMKTALLVVSTALLLAIVSARGIRDEQSLRNSIEKALIMEAFNDEVAHIAVNLARIAMDRKQKQTSIFDHFPSKKPRTKSPEEHKEKINKEQQALIKESRDELLNGKQPRKLTSNSKHVMILYMAMVFSI